MAVDKNLPAMLDEKAYTVHVCFQHAPDTIPGSAPTKAAKAPQPVQAAGVSMFDETPHANRFTYVTNIPGLQPGMLVTVPVSTREPSNWVEKHLGNVFPNRVGVAVIVAVDDEVTIEPDSDIRYSWVIGIVDLAGYNELIDRNKLLERQYASAYKHNARRQFAAAVLAQLPDSARNDIAALLKGEK